MIYGGKHFLLNAVIAEILRKGGIHQALSTLFVFEFDSQEIQNYYKFDF